MSDHVTFGVSSHEFTEVLRLDREGMHYKGEVVKDAGQAYEVFMSVMSHMKADIDAHPKPWLWWRDPKVMAALGLCVGLIWGASWAR